MSSKHNPNGTGRKVGVLQRVLTQLVGARTQSADGSVNRHGYSHIDDATMAMFGLGRMRFDRETSRPPRY